MHFSLSPGLVLKEGGRCLELVRELDNADYLFEDTHTRRPSVISRRDLINSIFSHKYTVVTATDADSSQEPASAKLVDLTSLTKREREILELRFEYIRELKKLKVSRGRRYEIKRVIEIVGKRRGDPASKWPSTSSVMSWARGYEKSGSNPMALVDRYRSSKRKKRIPGELEDLIWKTLKQHYFTRAQRTLKFTHDQLRIELKRMAQREQPIAAGEEVSYATLARRVKDVDLYHRVASREGHARARMKCRTSFPDGVATYPMERVEIDHTPLNWVVICDVTGLPLGRPLLTMMIDAYSGYVVGFYLSFYGPGLTSVCGVVKNSLLPKEGWVEELKLSHPWLSNGLADVWVIDNGLEFHSFGFKTMAMTLGTDLMFCRVRTPWQKPKVERFFGGLNMLTLLKGKITKPMQNLIRIDPYKDAAITFSDLVKGLMMYIVDVYPHEPNWRRMATPYELFQEGLTRCPPAIYPGSLDDLKMASGMSKVLTFGQGGIEFMGLPYGSYDFKWLANRFGGKLKVLVKWDPDDMGVMKIQAPDKSRWIDAQCRWWDYANGLSFNQHKIIRQYARADLKSSQRLDDLLSSRQRLSEHWLDATTPRRRNDALKAARFSGMTSARILSVGEGAQPGSEVPAGLSDTQLMISEDMQYQEKDIPDFNSFVM